MSSNSIIKVEGLSKKYLLNTINTHKSDTLYASLINKAKSLKNITKKQQTQEFWALKDVSFEVNQGDRVGIIGRNGAGKSTLLKILSRITPPTKGRIEIDGRLASLLEVGTGFHGDLSGRENIFLNGSILGMNKAEIDRKFDEIVDFAEVEQFLDTPVKRYSSGMYVRLAFAVAAHLEPEILIVDEVLAVGDAAFQKKCLGKMNEISDREGKTILFVSHSMQAVQKLCTTGIYLKNGELIEQNSIDKIVNLYLNSGDSLQSNYQMPMPKDVSFGYASSVSIENSRGESLSEIPVGDPWFVKIIFKILKPTEHFIIGLGIVSAFDQAIRTSWSEPQDLDSGEYEITFSNGDVMLTTGIYKLVVGLSSNERAFYYDDQTVNINISDAGNIASNSRVVNTHSGLILNPMPYKLNKLN